MYIDISFVKLVMATVGELHKGSNTASFTSPVLVVERMKPGHLMNADSAPR